MFLLDTNVVSELRRRARADRSVLAWADAQDADTLFLSCITILEIEKGALLLQRRDAIQAADLRRWMQSILLPVFSERILTFDIGTALRCAALHVPKSRPERDAMIAATALVHGLTIVTRNVRDFEQMGVKLVNPWTLP